MRPVYVDFQPTIGIWEEVYTMIRNKAVLLVLGTPKK
jgi:hypothetical protein